MRLELVARRRHLLLLALGALLLGLLPTLAAAELGQRGDLFVNFSGGIVPQSLPRGRPAAIAVRIASRVETLSGERPPALRRIVIEINRAGHLDTRGLPVCRLAELEPSSDTGALAACRPALVGDGSYVAGTTYPGQSAFPSSGRILAFNSTVGGHHAILLHLYGTVPASISRTIVFRIHGARGTYGTVLAGDLPASLNPHGYIERLALSLHRRFTYRGRRQSYLSAACAAPAGFPGAVFPFARTSMRFADGRTLAATLTRSCSVRDGG